MKLIHIKEPELSFYNEQKSIDPRDGLVLFGPYEKLQPYSVKAGVIGTSEGLKLYKSFVSNINKPIISKQKIYGKLKSTEISRPSFPGFESIFDVSWPTDPLIFCELEQNKIDHALSHKKKKIRVNELVDLYNNKIIETINKEDVAVNIWIVIVPKKIYLKSRPNSPGSDLSSGTKEYIKKNKLGQGSLLFEEFDDYDEEIKKLSSSKNNFHDLLKARLLYQNVSAPIQLFVEPTLEFKDKIKETKYEPNMKAHLAWTVSSSIYYKLGGLPWKLHGIREGVCYVGLVFKKFEDKQMVCSAAQMFLNDGDGSVFRGNIGLWASEKNKEHHLDKDSAKELLAMALDDYKSKKGSFPKELFIHGRARFNGEEWNGFEEAIKERDTGTILTGVIIKEYSGLKLFRDVENEISNYGVLRGMAIITGDREAYLFTNGYMPRLQSATTLEVPNPLKINIYSSDVKIEVVLEDILALTKLNYNACSPAGGVPVTLKFSDRIGNILTATDNWKSKRRQFKYYI